MKFAHSLLPHAVQFDSAAPLIIRIEEPKFFSAMLSNFAAQVNLGLDGDIVITDGTNNIKPGDIQLIGDIISYDCNKRLSAKLIADIADNCINDEALNSQYIKARQEIDKLFSNLIANSVLPLNFDNTDIGKLLKAGNPKIIIDSDTPAAKLCDIITVTALTKSAKVIAVVNCLCYFTEEEFDGIVQIANYYDMPLIFFEGYRSDTVMKNANNVIIDSDLCVIVL